MAAPNEHSVGVDLRVLPKDEPQRVGWGRRWKLRLWILIAIQAAMLLHILIWWIGVPYGWETLSPVEPSESIETVSEGVINAGAIFFAVALLSTAILGRWFCGWGCHVVLLQDWCLRLMHRSGIRPRLFRSRLLMLAPLLLALYMFVWPIVYRLVVARWTRPDLHWPGFRVELLTRDLWASMPGLGVAAVFLFLCGFVTVYVLGAKGFCTYACPYGGFFAPLDRLAFRRVHVDDSCEGCARCTAACTSNVRVHEQVAAYGQVIDTGCMRTTDCIEACPNDALAMKWGSPPLGIPVLEGAKKPVRRWDLTWSGEVVLAVLMFAFFLAWRGAYGLVPMLLSLGAASVMTWLCWKSWRLLRDQNASFRRSVLKRKGKLHRSGVWFLVVTVLLLLATLQAAASQVIGMRADWMATGLRQRIEFPSRPGVTQLSESAQARARASLEWYRLAGSLSRGGIGLGDDPNHLLAAARVHAQLGELEASRELLRLIRVTAKPNQDVAIEQFVLEVSLEKPREVADWLDETLMNHLQWSRLRQMAMQWALALGDLESASRFAMGTDAWKYAALAALQEGKMEAALVQLRRYLGAVPEDALAWITLARVQLQLGNIAAADTAAEAAAKARLGMPEEAQADLAGEFEAFRRSRADQVAP
ncbi:MAG: 4Fe-4S binding protein [Phycisphaerales bacterium]|jgi:NAD-dependent dihydropyrimidine dehydrogenase PreA subunit|nr:4Fe-4S binding protein [Phycisphaerales bacterium]